MRAFLFQFILDVIITTRQVKLLKNANVLKVRSSFQDEFVQKEIMRGKKTNKDNKANLFCVYILLQTNS
jgi:hypothetical protein